MHTLRFTRSVCRPARMNSSCTSSKSTNICWTYTTRISSNNNLFILLIYIYIITYTCIYLFILLNKISLFFVINSYFSYIFYIRIFQLPDLFIGLILIICRFEEISFFFAIKISLTYLNFWRTETNIYNCLKSFDLFCGRCTFFLPKNVEIITKINKNAIINKH